MYTGSCTFLVAALAIGLSGPARALDQAGSAPPDPTQGKVDAQASVNANASESTRDVPAGPAPSEPRPRQDFNLNQWRRIPDPNWGVPTMGIYPLPGRNLNVSPEPRKY